MIGMRNASTLVNQLRTVQTSGLKSERAYQLLKGLILSVELLPGTLISEAELMERYQVGRTPLREALQRLAVEGLVTTVPRRGTFVSAVGVEDVRAVYEMRCRLDAFAAELAAERATAQEVAEMEQNLREAGAAAEIDKTLFDQQMHELIARAAHNLYLYETLSRLYALSVRLFNLRHYQRETFEEMRVELGAVVQAIKSRDPEGAAAAALRHITSRGWFPELRPGAEGDRHQLPERSLNAFRPSVNVQPIAAGHRQSLEGDR
jgi:DNA-binding GntR family transcriptional regulator